MTEKNAPTRIWACMEGPMVGLFVSGGDSVDWPEYVRADDHDKLVEALEKLVAWKHAVDTVAPELGGLLVAIYNAEAILASLQPQDQDE